MAARLTFPSKRLGTIRLIATDLDGTLVNSDDEISARSAQALMRLEGQGILLSLLTGRTARGLERILPHVTPTAPIVCANGAEIMSPDGRDCLFREFIDREALRGFVDLLFSCGIDFIMRTEDDEVINANPDHPFLERKRAEGMGGSDPFLGMARVSGGDDSLLQTIDVVKMMLVMDRDLERRLEPVREYVEEEPRLRLAVCGPTMVDVAPAQVSKGMALARVCELAGVLPEECLYFGDYDNDVSAFEVAGVSVCMANGSSAAKAAADFVCASNDEDGVAEFVEQYLLDSLPEV